jgi:hypothetical protein
MKIKSEQEEAIGKIEKDYGISTNKFKIMGWFCVLFQSSQFQLLHSLKTLNTMMYWIGKTVLVLGLLIISISKEKIEDELIAKDAIL